MTIDALLDEAKKLAPAERFRLIDELWETLETDEPDALLTPEQAAELDRRLERFEREGSKGVPWDDFKKELFDRVAR